MFVDSLPADERHMVETMYFGGWTLIRASTELGVSRSTGRRILDDGLARLKVWLEDGHELPAEEPLFVQEGSYVDVNEGKRAHELLTTSEAEALINGRYRGDGRRLDQYTTLDPLGWYPE